MSFTRKIKNVTKRVLRKLPGSKAVFRKFDTISDSVGYQR